MTASTVRFFKTDPGARPAALVATWLIDALAGATAGVRLSCSNTELIMLDVRTSEAHLPIHQLLMTALAEARFAGWELSRE